MLYIKICALVTVYVVVTVAVWDVGGVTLEYVDVVGEGGGGASHVEDVYVVVLGGGYQVLVGDVGE